MPLLEAFDVLEDVPGYPEWWHEVRHVTRIDDRSARVTIRSVLPVDLRFVLTQTTIDRSGGVLEASMSGDLEGWSRWTLREALNGTVARFEEMATLNKSIPPILASITRPIWNANHSLMMRSGKRGIDRRHGHAHQRVRTGSRPAK